MRIQFSSSLLILMAITVLLLPVSVLAEETKLDVRVLSKGAKFIGSSMGGVRVTIANADTGEVLASGKTSGSTGDTQLIMTNKAPHHAAVSSEGAAVFHAELDIDEPTRLVVRAYGPLAQRQAAGEVSATQWIIPGKDITGGDALRLEMPGFIVDVLDPPSHVKLAGDTEKVRVAANVTMMCGCPIKPEGIWDANDYEVQAIIKRDGKPFTTVALQYAGETSQFATDLEVKGKGVYEVAVYAFDSSNGNTGVDFTTFIVE
jgi:hypothetical protein